MYTQELLDLCIRYAEVMPKRIPKQDVLILRDAEAMLSTRGFDIVNNRQIIHIINNGITITPTCPICGKHTKWLVALKRYADHCSLKCSNNDEKVQDKARQSASLTVSDAAAKRKQTNLERYGHTNYLASEQGKNTITETLRNKYGVDNISQDAQSQAKKVLTSISKYGVSHYAKSAASKVKHREQMQQRFGCDSWAQKHMTADVLSKLNDKEWMILQHITNHRTCASIAVELDNIDSTTVARYLVKHGIGVHNYTAFQSSHEQEMAMWLDDMGIQYVQNDRTVLKPKELDFVFEQEKVAIEICGVYWHGDWRLDKNYHKDKYEQCKKAGYQLLTIFEDEWVHAKAQTQQMILHKLNRSCERKVNARDTTVVDVSKEDRKVFMDQHHIQGDGPGSVTYGLNADGVGIVAMVTLIVTKNGLTLNRYATSCNVRGGFSKLLAHIDKHHNYGELITFADLRWSNGGLYRNNGFVEDKEYGPMYCYVVNKRRVHRAQFRRQYLAAKLPYYDPSKSEFENCDANGIVRLWDCGMIKYRYNKKGA